VKYHLGFTIAHRYAVVFTITQISSGIHSTKVICVCSGDVKYHLGFTMDRPTINKGKSVHISLCANPSHLEAVNPIVEVLLRLIKLLFQSLLRYYLRLY